MQRVILDADVRQPELTRPLATMIRRSLSPSLLAALALLTACANNKPLPAPPEELEPEAGPDDPGDPTSPAYVDPLADASEPDGAPAGGKPPGCDAAEDCAKKGAAAVLGSSPNEGIPMLEWACAEKVGQACEDLSIALRSGRVAADPDGARDAATRGCELGSHSACVDLGVDEHTGQGGDKDSASALARFDKACEAGEPMGCRFAGVLHHEGAVGAPDQAKAMKYFERGCDKDDGPSCFNSAALIIQGHLPDMTGPDAQAKADGYLRRACDLGDDPACKIQGDRAAAAATPAPAGPPDPAGANLSVGSATVDGLTVESLACRVEGGGLGLLGSAALIGSLAKKKKSLDKCGKKGQRVRVAWTAKGGHITKASGDGKEAACVAKLLKKLKSPVTGDCVANFVLGE